PEQARGLVIDERTDIWSLGVVLYEMLVYRAPFNGATRMDTMVAILEREPAPLLRPNENSSPAMQRLQNVVAKALCKERAERYQTAAELHADLTSIRQQLNSGIEPTAEVALDLMRVGGKLQGSQTSTTLPREQAASPLPVIGETNGYRRYGLMVLSLGAIAVLIAGVFLYQRARLRGSNTIAPPVATATTNKLYAEMNPAQQLHFVDEQEQRISAMMGEHPVKLNDEALQAIKRHVDRYVARKDSTSDKPGAESLKVIYARSAPYVPMIARAFAARNIPIVIGIYLPMIESGYRPCLESSFGAKGLFQFLPSTAKQYGMAPGEMFDAEKMAPAAAHYIADRMAELGDDSQSMTLVLLSYNSGTDPVLDALRRLRETDTNYERNFWTLYANRDKLDDAFRNESAGYVPAFFAAAIIGENPQNFDLPTPALSTLAKDSTVQR
ncbi:MAG TPA: transglycosylase SLT domain-containing protein, partial [Pyrinomonadaceae bacterium]|nr:transglycosylase SLT domain-containing protein [Pyrinomonadaceae bacterium]